MEGIKRITDTIFEETGSNTPYDDAFRTMMGKSGVLRVAFINEMFHPSRPIKSDTKIVKLSALFLSCWSMLMNFTILRRLLLTSIFCLPI